MSSPCFLGRKAEEFRILTSEPYDWGCSSDSSRPSAGRFTARRVDATHSQGHIVHASLTIPRPRARGLSRSLRGPRFLYPRVRRRRVAPSRPNVWRRVSRRALDAAGPLVPGNCGADMVWASPFACRSDFLLRLAGCQGENLIPQGRRAAPAASWFSGRSTPAPA